MRPNVRAAIKDAVILIAVLLVCQVILLMLDRVQDWWTFALLVAVMVPIRVFMRLRRQAPKAA